MLIYFILIECFHLNLLNLIILNKSNSNYSRAFFFCSSKLLQRDDNKFTCIFLTDLLITGYIFKDLISEILFIFFLLKDIKV